jgi:hypothetical protein
MGLIPDKFSMDQKLSKPKNSTKTKVVYFGEKITVAKATAL